MSSFSYDPEESLGFMTITANRLMSSFLRRKMKEAGIDLTAEQWGVLVLLWNKNDRTQDELAHISCVDKSSMSRILALMEKKGLIIRRADPSNARRKIIRTSDKAQELQGRSLAVVQEITAMMLRDVNPQAGAVCLNVLAAIKQTLREIDR